MLILRSPNMLIFSMNVCKVPLMDLRR